jgi:MFS family permease
VCVTFFSISNAASRVITGHFTDVGMNKGMAAAAKAMATDPSGDSARDSAPSSTMETVRAVLNTRPTFLMYLNGGMVLSQLLALCAAQTKSAPLLYIAVILGGLAFGGVFPQIVIVTSELFGKKHVGGNILSPSLSSPPHPPPPPSLPTLPLPPVSPSIAPTLHHSHHPRPSH